MFIQTKNLTKTFRANQADNIVLDDITLDIAYDEDLAIVGSNGSGKTTLLNMIGLLDAPTTGSLWIDGKDTTKMSSKELSSLRNNLIGFVFQHFNIHNYLTIEENVAMPAIISGLSKDVAVSRAKEILEMVEMTHRLGYHPEDISGGERQRVAIARALINDPKILLADEPTGALDGVNSHQIITILKKLAKKDMNLIVVTHDREVASSFNKILHLQDGKITQ